MSILTSAWKYIKAKFSKKEYYPLWVFLHIHTNLKICIDGLPMVHVLWLLLGALNCYAIKMPYGLTKKEIHGMIGLQSFSCSIWSWERCST